MTPHRLVLLSGPSCMGKTPLARWLRRLYPDVMASLRPLVLYNSRKPRPGERDGESYHFRSTAQLRAMRGDPRYAVVEVRNDLQAVDLEALEDMLQETGVLFEGSPATAAALHQRAGERRIPVRAVFIAPLSGEEISSLRGADAEGLDELVAGMMLRKQLRRAAKLGQTLDLPAVRGLEVRAAAAPEELRLAHRFDYVVPNHDGEDSEHWDAYPAPIGDAGKTVHAVAALLRGQAPALAERWPAGLLE